MTSKARAAYEAWHDRLPVDAESDTPWHRLLKERLEPARDLAGRRVLEIGCGRGGFAVWLASQPTRPALLIGADFSRTALAKALGFSVSRGLTQVFWVAGDIQHLAHPDNSFDTVISCETIEHVPDPAAAVQELSRLLRPGGRLFLTTPNYLSVMGLYRGYRQLTGRPYTEEGQPINHLTLLPRTLRWCRAAGLRIELVDGVGHYLPYPGRAPVELRWMNRARSLTRWVALHPLVVGVKPSTPHGPS